MPILNPIQNINSIISLIENAEKYVVLVSPYSNLIGWDKLKIAINEASKRNIEVAYYVREGEGSKGIEELNVKIYEVPMLHAKMFFNEKSAIISSFHLMNNNDINWAFKLNNKDEYKGLIDFFELNIKPLAKFFKNQVPEI
jgi:hypothetical protein